MEENTITLTPKTIKRKKGELVIQHKLKDFNKMAQECNKNYANLNEYIKELKKQVADLQAKLQAAELQATKQDEQESENMLTDDDNSQHNNSANSTNGDPSLLGTPNEKKEKKKVSEPAPPPIFVEKVENFIDFQEAILTKVGGFPNFPEFATLNSGVVKIKAQCADSYRMILSLLHEMQGVAVEHPDEPLSKVEYYCYKLKQERNYCFIIRGLHPTIELEKIKNALFQQGYIVKNIINIRRKVKTNDGKCYCQLPLHRVEITSTDKNKEVFDIKHLLYTKVKIEEPRKTMEIPQCTRCQQYGHTKNFCARAPKCVKCAGNHLTKDCKKSIDTEPVCANCGGEHPANYKGCPVYKKRQEAMHPKKKNINQRMQEKQHQPIKPVTDNLSYAQAAKSGNPSTSALEDQGWQQPGWR